MPTRTQAGAALDAAVAQMKNDVTTTLPANVNIIRGSLAVNPTSWALVMSVATLADGVTLRDAITTSLTAQNRPWSINNLRRSDEARALTIYTAIATYTIVGY